MNQEDVLEESVITVTTELPSPLSSPGGYGGDSTITSSFFDSPGGPQPTPRKTPKKRTSLLKWFDKSVEKELEKRRNDPFSPPLNISGQSGLIHPLVVESSTSGIDIQAQLRYEQNTDLLDAVDKLAKAEAMVAFEGAVRAAEQAAASAPPEFAEEAAVAGARGYQAEITNVVQNIIPGIKPVEVVGYVGITRPRRPKRS